VSTRSPEESRLSEIDTLAEEAYALRCIDSQAALELAASALRAAERAGHPHGIVRALVAAGAARGWLADLAASAADLERALEILATRPDPIGRARALSWQAMIARRRADYSTSMELCAEALALFWSAGDRHGEGDVLRMIGVLQLLTGDFVSALERFAECRQTKEELDDPHGLALCANDTAIALFELGEYEGSRQSLEEALAYFRKTGSVSTELPALSNLGGCYLELGEHARAQEYLEECIAKCRQTGERLPEARALYNLGRVHHAMSDPQRALGYFAASEELSRTLGERRTEIGAMIGAARTLLELCESESALEKLTRALSAAESSGIQRVVAEAHQALAEAYESGGDLETTVRHLKAFHHVREKVQRASAALRTQHRTTLAELKRMQHETELQVLKAQLQPHFLFNALNSLSALIRLDPAEASRMVVKLGELLRLALVQSGEQCTSLDAEIEFVAAYLELERVFHRGRFSHSIEVEPEIGGVRVPHLLLQPLAENAVRHGLARGESGGRLEIRATRASANRLLLTVRDTGVGLPAGWSRKASGVGLRNTRLRLQRLYGAEQEFSIGPAPGGGTLVEIRLPLARSTSPAPAARAVPGA
jgi:tetratricopeptide (TPR) repeat protein